MDKAQDTVLERIEKEGLVSMNRLRERDSPRQSPLLRQDLCFDSDLPDRTDG